MEVALTVGGAFLSSFLAVAFDKIASSRKFIEFFEGEKLIEFDEETLDKLEITLETISEVLEDAEEKQTKTPRVRRWLGKVRAEVNNADDLLDELNTECLRIKLHYQHDQSKGGINSGFIQELMPKLNNVTQRLESFMKQVHLLQLQKFDGNEKYPDWAPSSSVVDKSHVFGRDDEKEKMIQRVLSGGGDSDVSVVAITGMGGIGKTTLAQLVYNDDRVKVKFKTRAWVCVSEEYDALRVTKALLMEVNSGVVDDKDDFNRLQVKLKDNLAGKCFLIILDDVWNENYNDWSRLKNPLNYGSKGSKIIVTTRNENVALLMQNEPFHHVQPIPEDQSWSLFKSHAFDNGDHTLLPKFEFETIGKKIVKKCKGLPLAIKAVAGALRPKTDICWWRKFLNSDIWAAGGDIMPALRLSYKHLPSHLKCCFAFCALFPKDVPFKKDAVVLLWMANDLVKPSTQKDGSDYFEELKSRSFFESVNGKKYLMHDLISDLAQSVSGNTCIRLEDYQAVDHRQSLQRENELPPQLLHFSYMSTFNETYDRFSGLAQTWGLRTFLPIHQYQYTGRNLATTFFSEIISRFQRLRVLNLSQYRITMVPDSIGDLKHLRFLNLASTYIKWLPNAIGKCLNLQTLILKNCKELVELPTDMRFLINLQHLDLRGLRDHFIRKMDIWLSIFKDIPNIYVVVDKIQGIELEILVQLQLSHSLNIIGLGDTEVVTIKKAKSAGLIDKKYIRNLSLEWSGIATCSQGELNKFSILEPHTNTKQLSIKGYKGTMFPEWLGDSAFSKMESLSLEDCKNCFFLPPLGQLTGLKKLYISGMDGITEIGTKFYGDASTSKPFQALEELKFCDMAEWAIWNTHSDADFSSLKSFSIKNCPKLISDLPCGDLSESIPLFSFGKLVNCQIREWGGLNLFNGYHQTLTSLQSLMILNCNNILCFPEGGLAAPNLKRLEVLNCKKMKSLPARMRTQLPLLSYLRIWYCPEIEWFPDGGLPPSLETLEISNCSKMRICQTNWGLQTLSSLTNVYLKGFNDTLFPEEGFLPASVQKLFIQKFPNMESLNYKGLQHLCSLRSLYIIDCRNLKYLPQGKLSSSLSEVDIRRCELVESFPKALACSLTTLYVSGCPKLAARIQREKGKDWPKISHIPSIQIDFKII